MKEFLKQWLWASCLCMLAFSIVTLASAADKGGQAVADESDPVAAIMPGLYVSVGVGMTSDNHDLGAGGSSIELSADGIQGSLGLGLDIPLGKDAFIGLFGDIAWRDAEVNAALGGIAAKAGYDTMYSIGGRVGTHLNETTSIYLNGGWNRLAEGDASATGVGSISLPDLDGWFIGGGMAHYLNENMSIGLEGRYRWYDTDNSLGVGIDADGFDVMTRLNYKIGGFFNN